MKVKRFHPRQMSHFSPESPVRRKLLCSAAILTSSVFSLTGSGLNAAQNPGVVAQRLSDKVLLVKGPEANVLVVDSTDGLVMVDGGHASWFDALHTTMHENFPGRPVRALFNTHWHREQTGSNEALGMQGVEIIAHENTRLWLGTEVWQRWSDTVFPPLPDVALPGNVVLDSGAMVLGKQHVQLHYLWNAHTDGDLAVYFEEENVLVCGGLVSNGQWPDIDWWTGGYTGGMLDSFLSLLTVPNENTIIIPAVGEVMTVGELRTQNRMYVTVIDRLHELFLKSYSLEEIIAAKPTAEFDAQMGNPEQFLTLAFQSLNAHLRDPQNFRLINLP
jgi:glyoxylase-like metal-dependent hydrolase (beta-lactamase superfamily II)